MVDRRAGSEPTWGSVRAKAEISPAAQRGRYFLLRSSLPNVLSGCGTPIDWISYADRDTFYCPGCQTGGVPLKDRRLSKLLK